LVWRNLKERLTDTISLLFKVDVRISRLFGSIKEPPILHSNNRHPWCNRGTYQIRAQSIDMLQVDNDVEALSLHSLDAKVLV